MRVEIMSTKLNEKKFLGKEGKPDTVLREQTGAVLRDGQFALPFTFNLKDGQEPYPAGLYEFHEDSVQNSKYGGLDFARYIVLRPLKPTPASKLA